MSPKRETEKRKYSLYFTTTYLSAAELSKIYRRSSSDQYMPILLGSAADVRAHISLEDLDYAIEFLFKYLFHASLCSSSYCFFLFVNYWSCYHTIH